MRLDLDEYTEKALTSELELRADRRSKGLCDYCGRVPETTPCKFLRRHKRALTSPEPSGPFTLSHREAELIREHVMGDLRGPNKDEFKTVFQRIDEFVCAKWDAEDDEPDSDANKVHGIRLTTTNWVCENGGDDITGTKEEMEAKAAEYRASLYPGPLVEYKVAVYKP